MDNRKPIYNLPFTTEEILVAVNPSEKCENLGLLLDKYIPSSVFEKTGKAPWLLEIFKPTNGNETQNNHIDAKFARSVYNRWYTMMRSLGVEPLDLSIDWRMIVGLGGETVLETDITLHHLYGIPIIPGSALKGLTRAYVSEEHEEFYIGGNQPKASKKSEEDHPDIQRIFGSQTDAGTVVFFDAMPKNGQAQFVVDIMNPHYSDYYRSLQSNDIKAPANDQKPIPIPFLAVKNTVFTFAIAPRHPKYEDDVEKVIQWLQEALQKYGVGGKTSAGYGYFKVEPQYHRPKMQQFSEGETIRGLVIDEKTDPIAAHYITSGQASKCLQYQIFSSEQVLILIEPQFEEAKQWKTKNVSICQFIEERVEDNRTLLICQPKKKGK